MVPFSHYQDFYPPKFNFTKELCVLHTSIGAAASCHFLEQGFSAEPQIFKLF